MQITERDEFMNHEMMAHVPVLAHSHARNMLIIRRGTTLYRVKYHVRDFTYDVNKENIFHTKILLKEIYLQHCTSHTEPKEFREEEPNVITGLLWREIREIYSP